MANTIQGHLRNTFLAGALAAIPVAGTAFLIWYIDANTRILSRKVFGADVPFLGVVIAVIAVYLLGLAVRSLVGRILLRLADRTMRRVPVLRTVYQTWKQVVLTPGEGIFAKVVLIPDEGGRMSLIGFTSGKPTAKGGDTLAVFVPAAPNPMSGRLCLVRREDCRFVAVSNEEAFKMILSSGSYVPEGLGSIAPMGVP